MLCCSICVEENHFGHNTKPIKVVLQDLYNNLTK